MSDGSDDDDDDLQRLLPHKPSINVTSSVRFNTGIRFTDSYIQQCQDNYLSFHNVTQIIHPRKYVFCRQLPKTVLHSVRYVQWCAYYKYSVLKFMYLIIIFLLIFCDWICHLKDLSISIHCNIPVF